jgi:nucleoside-diphosphate-sugar epimerase
VTGRERVLVTGGSGFLGRPLIRRLAAGHEVYGASRGTPDLESLGIGSDRWRQTDLADATAARDLLAELRPDVVVHLTSESRGAPDRSVVEATFRNDLEATVRLLEASASTGIRRLILATSLDEPLGRGDEATPSTPYAAAKWAAAGYARMYARQFGLPVTILRLMMVYGPGQKPFKVVPTIILSMLAGEAPRLSSGDRPLDWVFLDDVIDAFQRVIEAEALPVGPLDIGTGRLHTVRDMAERIHAAIPGSPAPTFGALADRPHEVVRRARTRQAREALGWRATTPLRVGIQRTIESYRDSLRGTGASPERQASSPRRPQA